jgi:hypothetical protein
VFYFFLFFLTFFFLPLIPIVVVILSRLTKDPPVGVNGTPVEDNILLWNAIILG